MDVSHWFLIQKCPPPPLVPVPVPLWDIFLWMTTCLTGREIIINWTWGRVAGRKKAIIISAEGKMDFNCFRCSLKNEKWLTEVVGHLFLCSLKFFIVHEPAGFCLLLGFKYRGPLFADAPIIATWDWRCDCHQQSHYSVITSLWFAHQKAFLAQSPDFQGCVFDWQLVNYVISILL